MTIEELVIDENAEMYGIDAISLVEQPAIESNFVALKDQQRHVFQKVDDDKRIVMGPALIPDKPIYRRRGDEELYVYFSKATVRRAMELFFESSHQNNTTLEHEHPLNGLTVVESWIVEGEQDKSRAYGLDVPVGTWMVSMKVNNDAVWTDYVKTGKVLGFSIEGFFVDKAYARKKQTAMLDELARVLVKNDGRTKTGKRLIMESFRDYPDVVSNNAKRGRELNEKVNNRCATQVGKIRSKQLESKEPVSLETVKRMYSYLSRADEYYDPSDSTACGTISYLLWGGKAGLRWAKSKLREQGLKQVENFVLSKGTVDDFDWRFVDDRLLFATHQEALSVAEHIGFEEVATHELNGRLWFEPKTNGAGCQV